MLIKINNVGQYGVVRDAFAPELPANAWSNGRNMRFRNGYAERMLGETAVYDPPTVTPYHIQPLTTWHRPLRDLLRAEQDLRSKRADAYQHHSPISRRGCELQRHC
jgi:hypothetical protein